MPRPPRDRRASRRVEDPPRAVHEVGADRDDAADREEGDHGLADADQRVHADHRGHQGERAGCRRCRPPRRAGRRPAPPPGPRPARRRPRPARPSTTSSAAPTGRPRKTSQPTPTVTMRHQHDVGAERGDAAVGEQQALHERGPRSCRAARSQGPTSTAARAPPRRWPLVPAPTGKLSICVAKMKVATRPASGAVRSSSSRRAPEGERDPCGRDHPGGDRGRCVQESVGHVHGDLQGVRRTTPSPYLQEPASRQTNLQ